MCPCVAVAVAAGGGGGLGLLVLLALPFLPFILLDGLFRLASGPALCDCEKGEKIYSLEQAEADAEAARNAYTEAHRLKLRRIRRDESRRPHPAPATLPRPVPVLPDYNPEPAPEWIRIGGVEVREPTRRSR